IFLPIGDRKMPPFSAHSPKPGAMHCPLQQTHVTKNFERSTRVTPHSSRRKIIKVTWHANGTIPCVHQGSIDGDSPTVRRADADFRVRNIVTVVRCLPKLCLYVYRPIGVPDFQSISVITKKCLGLTQSCGNLRPDACAHALRVKRVPEKIVISRVAQLYHDRWIDRLNINKRAFSICVDR